MDTIKDLVPVRNEVNGWNSQDWVLDLLEALEKRKVIDLDARYNLSKARIRKLVERKGLGREWTREIESGPWLAAE